MSRFSLTCSLVLALSSLSGAALAKRVMPVDMDSVPVSNEGFAPKHAFAQPPPAADMPVPSVVAPPVTLDRASVRAALVQARARNLAAFRAYQKRGVFPSNTFQGKKLNVWLDADGHFCAAATIIRTSGQVDLVDKVAQDNNFIRLADVKQGPLMDWMLTSGFTQDEIAAIQEPFMPVYREPSVEPSQPILVDARLRKAENARLIARYKVVDRMLVKNASASLDKATDRLMKHAELAWHIVSAE